MLKGLCSKGRYQTQENTRGVDPKWESPPAGPFPSQPATGHSQLPSSLEKMNHAGKDPAALRQSG